MAQGFLLKTIISTTSLPGLPENIDFYTTIAEEGPGPSKDLSQFGRSTSFNKESKLILHTTSSRNPRVDYVTSHLQTPLAATKNPKHMFLNNDGNPIGSKQWLHSNPRVQAEMFNPIPEAEPEPEPEVTSEPTFTSEPEVSFEPETELFSNSEIPQEHEPESENEQVVYHMAANSSNPEPEPETDSEPEVYVEPVPEWDIAKSTWGPAWECHVYVSGILFVIIALYSLSCIIRLRNRANLLSRGYFIMLNLMLFIIGITRGVYFLVDPYNAQELFHPIFAYFLFSTSFPCLTAAFSIQLLALMQTLRLRPSSAKISNVKVLAVIISLHFLLSVSTDVVVGAFAAARVMVLVCQAAFCIWGAFISCAYFYVFRKLYKAAKRRQGMVRQLSKAHRTNSKSIKNGTGPAGQTMNYFEKPKLTMVVALKFTFLTSVFGLLLAGLQLYAMCSVFNVLSTRTPDAWPWWTYQLCMRLLEIAMCFTMMYVASQPLRYNVKVKKHETLCHELLLLLPCHRLCCSPILEGAFTSQELQYFEHSDNTSRGPSASTALPVLNLTRKTFPIELLPSPNKTLSMRRHTESNVLNIITSTPVRKTKSYPKVSMLINDSGFIRFREEGEIGEPGYVSTDDDVESRAHSRAASKKSWTPGPDLRKCALELCRETNQDELINHCDKKGLIKSASMPNTGTNTPVEASTPKSFCSTETGGQQSDVFSFRAPSSIHLRDSIDRALNYDGFRLKTPDSLNISDTLSSIPNSPESCGTNAFLFDATLNNSHQSATHFTVAPNMITATSNGDIKLRNNARVTLNCNNTIEAPWANAGETEYKLGSNLSVCSDRELFSGSRVSTTDISPDELQRRISMCRSNSDFGVYVAKC